MLELVLHSTVSIFSNTNEDINTFNFSTIEQQYLIVSSGLYNFGNLGPFAQSMHFNGCSQLFVFFFSPRTLLQIGVENIHVSLSALNVCSSRNMFLYDDPVAMSISL